METGELQSRVNNPQIAQILDNLLDAVLALRAQLANSYTDSNSVGGIRIPPPLPYNIPMDSRPL
jgi:hypothetical protein